ncbi:hypothetical protein [Microlunatus soli]|uniref:Copper(I)-binding protein n=1 Tax=Microlunatus soli TaxID=630515 RepID=A0A1H1S1D5_9ACTN|nr:hypothetical protein [Microlunatus soli]SDS41668.1 hypothetical protein SAMN04489812_1842 [Microlunatus soli]
MKQTVRSSATRRVGMVGRIAGICASAGLIFGLSACGFDVQTLQTYQPADGVDVNVAVGKDGKPDAQTIKVRGLMILAKSDTSGFLSATFTTGADDQLTGVTGSTLTANDSEGAALKVDLKAPVQLTPGEALVLTKQDEIKVTADKLQPGLNANLTLTFANAGSEQVTVPIVDGNNTTYRSVSPSPEASSATS